MNLDLFQTEACDHLPNQDRLLTGGYIVCHKCGKKLRPINYVPEATNGKK